MTDLYDARKRSEVMRAVKSRHTRPEVLIRSTLHGMGYRFRLHSKALPGSPDILLPRHRLVIFVHGCFWHGHDQCPRARMPKTNRDYWKEKIRRNQLRDRKVEAALLTLGYSVEVVWGCEAEGPGLRARLQEIVQERR